MNKNYFFTVIFLFYLLTAVAQQSLSPLEINADLNTHYRQQVSSQAASKEKAANKATLIPVDVKTNRLIFRDDFSDYAGWPNRDLWLDKQAYINTAFGSSPYTLGVATFDGLDSTGYPYNFFDQSAYGKNDSLTSQPIDLGTIDLTDPDIDTVYFSFFYQPQGMNPFATEQSDSLILLFYDVTLDDWSVVWSAEGTARHNFKKVTILVDEKYYQTGFQFRFVNYGNKTGNVDHWHIDYVYMTSNTLSDHEVIEDMALRTPINTLLEDYTAMPWWHYSTNRMSKEVNLDYYYFNTNKPKSSDVKSWLQVLDADGNEVFQIATDNPEFSTGFLGSKTINWPFNTSGANVYPPSSTEQVNFFTYKFYHTFNNFTIDSNRANDTIIQHQVFGSYYAYDDGSAEAGYGVFGAGHELAYGFDIGGLRDTLRAVNIYFTPLIHDRTTERFRLAVWKEDPDNEGMPGELIHRNSRLDRPTYSTLNKFKGVGNFVRYNFDKEIVLTGKFFVGWEKVTDQRMNVGYDVNRNAQEHIFFNIGNGWQESDSSGGVVPGSLMIRPVFRNLTDPIVSVNELEERELTFTMYPNPANDRLYVRASEAVQNEAFEIQLINMNGTELLNVTGTGALQLDLSTFSPGLYIIRLNTYSGRQEVKKLLIAR